ncbi:MAG TPA: hypothetical protein VJL58_04480 [Pyrinomonadaceae bacterium]|nr:hypothetical protein [Pyrinomonadaceae bacterium]
MRQKLLILTLMLGSLLIGLPVSGYSTTAKERTFTVGGNKPQVTISFGQPRRRRWRQNGRWYYGYRNYGQYRRTQVGNRRYRVFPEYYWDNGYRRVRYVRYYYN